MPKYRPFSKVKAISFKPENETMAEGFDMQAMFNLLSTLEQRVNTLQQENVQLRADQLQHNQIAANAAAAPAVNGQPDIFRIPDPIKIIPTFDGNKKQLSAWLSTAERTLNLFRTRVSVDVFNIYEQSVINKIEGKARDTVCVNGNPSTFTEVADILRSIYGDKNDMATYQTQLWTLKMEDSIHLYYRRTKEIVQNMKSLAKDKTLYLNHWDAINEFLDQESLAAFINGLSKPYFGYAQASKPEDLESAYAFLCKFKNAELTKKQTTPNSQKPSGKFNQKSDKFEPHPQHSSARFPRHSDRQKSSPMEIDPSLRSNRINNHDTCDDESEKPSDDVEDNNESSSEEEEVNFQIACFKEKLK